MSTPLDAAVSVFHGVTSRGPFETVPLGEMLQRIQTGMYRQRDDTPSYAEWTAQLRTLLTSGDGPAYKDARATVDTFTPCCALTTRATKVAWSDKLVSTAGVVHFDSDGVDDPEALKTRLASEPSLLFAFVSPSGHGLKTGFAAAGITSPDTYKTIWHALLAHLHATYPDVQFSEDPHVKYLHALCFVSHDPALYINAQAGSFVAPPPAPKAPPRLRTPFNSTPDYARVASALASIPNNDADYDTWFSLGTALHSTGESWARDLWDGWSRQSSKFDERKQEKSWQSFSSDGAVTIGTLFYLAKHAGWKPPRAPLSVKGPRPQARVVPDMTQPGNIAAPLWGPAPAGSHADDPQDLAPDIPALDASIYGPLPLKARNPDALPYSDYTNALAMVRDHGQNIRFCYPWGKWLRWTRTHWQTENDGAVMRDAKLTIKRLARSAADLDDEQASALLKHVKASLATSKLKAMIESAQSEPGIPVQPEDLDADGWLLNCTNRTLNLKTGKLQDHNRADLLTRFINTPYDPEASCSEWKAFLWRIMDHNQALITFLQRAIGYSLTGETSEQCLFILWGSGANGKSTFVNTLLTLLGPYAMKATAELLMVTRNDRHPTERADLFGQRFVAAIETEEGGRLNEVFVKEATGGDPIRARRMREDFWQFNPTHKVFLATNHKPVIRGTDHAIWRRIKLVPFTVTIPDADQDKQLPSKLHAELPGILAWAVRGCLDWQQKGLGEPAEVTNATAGYRQEMDVFEGFLADECFRLPHVQVKASDLYDAYTRWCQTNDVEALSKRTFGLRLSDSGCTPEKGTGGIRIWKGIGLPAKTDNSKRSGT